MNKKVYDSLTDSEKFLVDWQYGISGDFEKTLVKLICLADEYNRMKISLAYPDELAAMNKYFYEDGYWQSIELRLNTEEEANV